MSEDLNDLRRRCLAGEDLSIEDYRKILDAKREARRTLATAAVEKAAKSPKKKPATMSLAELDELLNRV